MLTPYTPHSFQKSVDETQLIKIAIKNSSADQLTEKNVQWCFKNLLFSFLRIADYSLFQVTREEVKEDDTTANTANESDNVSPKRVKQPTYNEKISFGSTFLHFSMKDR